MKTFQKKYIPKRNPFQFIHKILNPIQHHQVKNVKLINYYISWTYQKKFSINSLTLITIILTIFISSLNATPLKNDLNNKYLKKIPLKWKTRIGITTYRTTLQYANGYILAPSNGKSRSSSKDTYDGVHIINPKNGTLITKLSLGNMGDRDVNGVAISNTKIVFGNDDHSIAAFNWNYELLWKYKTKGDFEGAPSLTHINQDAILDVIAATEYGEVLALDGLTGTLIWKFKAGKNPKLIIPKTHYFIGSPSLIDSNKDKTKDIIIGNRNGLLYALNGKDGSVIWKHQTKQPSGILSSPFVRRKTIHYAESYGYIHKLNLKGRHLDTIPIDTSTPLHITATPILNEKNEIIIGSTNNKTKTGLYSLIPRHPHPFYPIGNISASAILANIDNTPEPEFIIISESGWLYILGQKGTIKGKYKLLTGSECTPLIADIDNDGLLELVIALNDQHLYAYDLPSKGPVIWGQLRANPYNTGVENDLLNEDSPINNHPNITNLYNQKSSTNGFRYNNWFSKPIIANQISKNGIGHAQLGMTLGQYKKKMDLPFTTKKVKLQSGLKALAIIINKTVHYYLVFSQQKPISDDSRINIIITNNPYYKTKNGIHSGSPINPLSKLLGPPTFSYNKLYPLEEKCRFNDQPQWLVFSSYSKIKAGNYTSNPTSHITRSYKPGAKIQFIAIRKIASQK